MEKPRKPQVEVQLESSQASTQPGEAPGGLRLGLRVQHRPPEGRAGGPGRSFGTMAPVAQLAPTAKCCSRLSQSAVRGRVEGSGLAGGLEALPAWESLAHGGAHVSGKSEDMSGLRRWPLSRPVPSCLHQVRHWREQAAVWDDTGPAHRLEREGDAGSTRPGARTLTRPRCLIHSESCRLSVARPPCFPQRGNRSHSGGMTDLQRGEF